MDASQEQEVPGVRDVSQIGAPPVARAGERWTGSQTTVPFRPSRVTGLVDMAEIEHLSLVTPRVAEWKNQIFPAPQNALS